MESRALSSGNERMDAKFLPSGERKGHKRKLADTNLGAGSGAVDGSSSSLPADVRVQVDVLKSCVSASEADRVAARRAAHALAEFAKQGVSLAMSLMMQLAPRLSALALSQEISEATYFVAALEDEGVLAIVPNILEDKVRSTIQEALLSDDADLWRAAIADKLQALEDTGTWTLVPRPAHYNIIGCKWVLKKKLLPDGSIDKYKAHLVAQGFTQKAGVDFHDTYSPVLGMTSFRLLVALATKFNLPLHHIDIKTAFLHGELHEHIYMHQPPLFENPRFPNFVCKLHKPLYGLKQSP
eukprot:c23982_g1_i1 orf=561-1451(+)